MAVNYEAFLSWAESRFDNIKATGKEIMVNSPFPEEEGLSPDFKTHLWCNVGGGKHNRNDGVYRCWKTDKIGTLTGLVMKVDGCTYEEAVELLGGHNDRGLIEKKMENFVFNVNKPDATDGFNIPTPEPKKIDLSLPNYTYPLTELTNHPAGIKAIEILKNRKLPWEGLYFCTRDEIYKNRIVIPYYGKEGELIYYNCRAIDKRKPKYRGPPEEVGVGKGDVLFMTSWPDEGGILYICEGEFDAMTLAECGVPSAAFGGKFLSDEHIKLLRGCKIVLAGDSDPVGLLAILKNLGNQLLSEGFAVSYVVPPPPYKDWNELWQNIERAASLIKYLAKGVKKFESSTQYNSNIVWKL